MLVLGVERRNAARLGYSRQILRKHLGVATMIQRLGVSLVGIVLVANSEVAQPHVFQGQGQQGTSYFQLETGLTTFNFRHAGKSNFVVWLLDEDGRRVQLIANEIGSCTGSKAIHIARAGTYLLDVSGDGVWTISRSVMYYNPYVRQTDAGEREESDVYATLNRIFETLSVGSRTIARDRYQREHPDGRFEDSTIAQHLDALDLRVQRLKLRMKELSFDQIKSEWQSLQREYGKVRNGKGQDKST